MNDLEWNGFENLKAYGARSFTIEQPTYGPMTGLTNGEGGTWFLPRWQRYNIEFNVDEEGLRRLQEALKTEPIIEEYIVESDRNEMECEAENKRYKIKHK